jgi:queuine tRNA-ribosyltransferase
MARELLAYRLLSLHNVTFYLGLLRSMREAIATSAFEPLRARILDRYGVESVVGPDSTSNEAEA